MPHPVRQKNVFLRSPVPHGPVLVPGVVREEELLLVGQVLDDDGAGGPVGLGEVDAVRVRAKELELVHHVPEVGDEVEEAGGREERQLASSYAKAGGIPGNVRPRSRT